MLYNNTYSVTITEINEGLKPKVIHIERLDGKPIIEWETLQNIKDAYYPNLMAVQIFPPNDKVVNNANIYHLWVLNNSLSMCLTEFENITKYKFIE